MQRSLHICHKITTQRARSHACRTPYPWRPTQLSQNFVESGKRPFLCQTETRRGGKKGHVTKLLGKTHSAPSIGQAADCSAPPLFLADVAAFDYVISSTPKNSETGIFMSHFLFLYVTNKHNSSRTFYKLSTKLALPCIAPLSASF